jgi:hypothetical protein
VLPTTALYYLRKILNLHCVQIEGSPDLIWRGWEHVKIVERTLISKTSEVPIANYLLVSFLPAEM